MTRVENGLSRIVEKEDRREMKWTSWLFGKQHKAEDPPRDRVSPAATPLPLLDLPNPFRAGFGTPFLVEWAPDLGRLFNSTDPPIPHEVAEKSEEFWKRLTLEEKRSMLAMAYLQHPDPWVRIRTIDIARKIRTLGVSQMFVNLLAVRRFPEVAEAAAAALWERDGSNHCKFTVHALRDEIRGYVAGPLGSTTTGLMLERDDAIRALDLLVAAAPDETSRKAIEQLIQEDVIIEERVKQVDTRSVRFIGIEQKDKFTYELYWAKGKEQALSFLSKKKVEKEFYYIEVETPEGNFGRDIRGIYDL